MYTESYGLAGLCVRFRFSSERQNTARPTNSIKTKLREELHKEIIEICGIVDRGTTKNEKKPETTNGRPRRRSMVATNVNECFDWVYECVSTRSNYLNIVSMKMGVSGTPEIDRVILQALLNGKHSVCYRSFLHAEFQWPRIKTLSSVEARAEINNFNSLWNGIEWTSSRRIL
jgi:hypothetical protein